MTPAARQSYDAHLRECAACRGLVADFSGVVSTLGSGPQEALDDFFTQRVLEAMRAAAARRRRTIRVLRVAACLAIMIGGGLISWRWAYRSRGDVAGGLMSRSPAPGRDTAVGQALDWLVRSQEASGGWDAAKWQGRKEYDVGLTGMALLALVRQAGEASDRDRCAVAIRRATENLLGRQDASGAIGPVGDGRMYNHGIATVALMEAARTDRDSRLRQGLVRAVDFIKSQQLDSGGWGYERREGEQANTSVSVWQLQALQLATANSLPDTNVAYRRGLRWLAGVVDGRGSFGYQREGDSPDSNDTLTAMGAFCLLGAQRASATSAADAGRMSETLHAVASRWDKETDYYRWFFLAQALRAAGGREFHRSLQQLQNSLLAACNRQGAVAGSWDPAGLWSPVAGRVFTTAMATLCLEPLPEKL
jgi:hypothetical protein